MRAFVEAKRSIYDVVHSMNYGKNLTLKDYPEKGKYMGIEKAFVRVDLCSNLPSKESEVISESDIVANSVETGVVKFDNGCFVVEFSDRKEYLYKIHDLLTVKGNMHLNPELLKSPKSTIIPTK